MKYQTCLIYTTLTLFFCLPAAYGAEVSGVREITILNQDSATQNLPQWKLLLDNARAAAQAEEYDAAKEFYSKLIAVKPNVELFQYEFARLLIDTKNCSQAAKILETLIYQQPDNLFYYLPAARCFEDVEQYGKASTYYGTLYDKEPYGEKSIDALRGLIRSLRQMNSHSAIIPLLHQLINRKPENPDAMLQLARQLMANGEEDEAVEYYVQLFNRFRLDKEKLLEIADFLDRPQYVEQLLKVRLQYLDYDPGNTQIRKKVIETYLADRHYEEALKQLLVLDKQRHIEEAYLLEVIGNIYLEQMGRPDKALQYYERYRQINESNAKIDKLIAGVQQKLAEDFVVIVQNDGAQLLWKDLEELTGDRKTIFSLIADLLEKADDRANLISVLSILHASFKDDLDLTYRLTGVLINEKRFNEAAEILSRVNSDVFQIEKFQQRLLTTVDGLKNPRTSLKLVTKLESVTSNIRNTPKLVESAFRFSVAAGEFQKAYHYYAVAVESGYVQKLPLDMQLRVLEYLDRSGRFALSYSYCQKLLLYPGYSLRQIIAVKRFLALSVSRQGDNFGAEQQLREVILEYPDIEDGYLNLAQFLNEKRRFEQAEQWLDLLQVNILNGSISVESKSLWKKLKVLNARKHIAAYDYDEAVSELVRLAVLYPDDIEIGRLLLKVYFLNEEYPRCIERISLLQSSFPGEWFSLITAQVVKQKVGKTFQHLNEFAKLGEGLSFDLHINVYRQLKLDNALIAAFDPQKSNAANNYIFFQMARVYENSGMYAEALSMFSRCSLIGDDSFLARQKEMELSFKSGQYNRFIQQGLSTPLIKNSAFSKYSIGLLYARSLWAVGRWDESLEEYQKLLRPSVIKQIDGVIDIQEKVTPGSWSVIYSHGGLESFDDLESLLQPEIVAEIIDEPVAWVLNGFYSQIQWEKMIQLELNARKALRERDYFYAESQYEKLVKESDEVSETKLLDLATIYNRLGKHSQEAEVYASMSAGHYITSDISTQVQKNKALLKPNIGIIFNNINSTGRDGYKDLAVHEYGLTGWLHTGARQSLDVYYTAMELSKNIGDENYNAHKLLAKYTADLNEDYSLSVAYGGLKYESTGTTPLYNVRAEGQVDDYLKAYFELSQDVVDDTVESLEEGLSHRDYRLGFLVDSIPRVIVGGDGAYRQISDGNDQQLYHLFTSYNIFQEKYLFKLQYDFESVMSQAENTYSYDQEDMHYWAPSSHWEHYVTAYLDFLLRDNTSFGGAPGHISIEYSLGYENSSDTTHRAKMNIFLEMSRNILLKGTISFLNSDDYESRSGLLSLVYRW